MTALPGTEIVKPAQGPQARLDGRNYRQSLARGRDDGFLQNAGGFVYPPRQIGDEPIDLLRELEEHSPLEFRVRRAADDNLVLDVDDDDPEHHAA